MALVPNQNGTEVTVLLLNADHYHTSDGGRMQPHTPLLFARAGGCSGDCVDDDTNIASLMFNDQTETAALTSLADALGDGSAWDLTGSDITVEKATSGAANLPALTLRDNVRGTVNGNPQIIPTSATERGDISWIASLTQVCGSGCTIDADVFDNVPPPIIAARFKLTTGDVYSHSIARIGSDVTPVNFKRLNGTGSTSAYVQAITTWVGAEIEVDGSSVKFVETKHDGGSGRSMTLSPDTNDLIEVAVINLPPSVPPKTTDNEAPQVGKHFEMYYDLLQTPPAQETRLVPRPGAPDTVSYPQVSWASVHPSTEVYSELLTRLRLDVGRSLLDRALCPPTMYP
ncbi:MAG TPA: hypothetical protein VHW00_08845 [Thermoanaerobaculia bacterium]|nr:hypothetical protein [Thermoanaerobaculia bacterium]